MLKGKVRKKRRNPSDLGKEIAENILSNVDNYKFIAEGSYSSIYYFIINTPIEINNIRLNTGEYILKVENWKILDKTQIDYLRELSDLKLIPKIYFIDDRIQIMKYVNAKTIRSLLLKLLESDKKIIKENLEILIRKWKKLKKAHGDIHKDNVLVDRNLNVYLIDPSLDHIWIRNPPFLVDESDVEYIFENEDDESFD